MGGVFHQILLQFRLVLCAFYPLESVMFLFHRSSANPSLAFLEEREHFIPLEVDTLMNKMLEDKRLTPEQVSQFREIRRLFALFLHFRYRKKLESLKRNFVPFDPDRDTLDDLDDLAQEELDEKCSRLCKEVRLLLKRCNFREMTEEQLDTCLEQQPVSGLSVYVNKQNFSEFGVFYRGKRKEILAEKRFFFFRWYHHTTVFSRVFVLARLSKAKEAKTAKTNRVLAKMFKDISVENLKIIVPEVRLGMPVFARLKIGGTFLTALATPVSKMLFALVLSWWLFIVVASGLAMAAFKGIMSFLNSKTKYLQLFSSKLYYCTVSNNKAALTSLIDTAEDQELKEALLAYFMLFVLRDRDLTMEQLDEAVEDWLKTQFGLDIDFEVDDAVRKLEEKDVFVLRGQIHKVYDLPSTMRQLDKAWDEFFSYNRSDTDSENRIAEGNFPPFP